MSVEGVSSMGSTITVEQLAEWCHYAGTRVSIRPVLDLTENLHVDRYAPTPRMREQVILTCPTCVFPGCGKTARRCDLDHITPWHEGGKTESTNLAPLCRLHHRMKTHGNWSYKRLTLTTFEWITPMGRVYVNDLTHKRRRTHWPTPRPHRERGNSHVQQRFESALGAVTTTVDPKQPPSRPARATTHRNHRPR